MRSALLQYDQSIVDTLMDIYKKLDPAVQKTVDLLAVIYQEVAYYDIQTMLNNLKIKLPQSPLVVLEELVKSQLIIKYRGGYRIAPMIAETLFEQLSKRPDFATVLTEYIKRMPRPNRELHDLVNFRIGLYTKNGKKQGDFGENLFGRFSNNACPAAVSLFCTPYSKERLNLIQHSETKKVVSHNIISHYLINGLPDSEGIVREQYAIRIKQKDLTLTDVDMNIYLGLIDPKFVDPKTPKISEYARLMVESVIAGDWKSAPQKLIEYKRTLSSETTYLLSLQLFFESILYLKNNDTKELESLVKFFRMSEPTIPLHGMFEPLVELISVTSGQKTIRNVNTTSMDPSQSWSIFGAFVRLLCSYWLDLPGHEDRVESFLFELKNQPVIPFFTDQIKLMETGEGLAAALPRVERWMGTVTSLLELIKNEGTTAKNERLYWRLNLRIGQSMEFKPVLQKRGKNGQWSKGRAVSSYYELSQNFDSIDCLPRDRELAIHWKAMDDDRWNRDRQNRTLRELMKDMIGHPRIFDTITDKQLTIVEEPLSIVTEKKNGTIRVTLKPAVPESHGIAFARKKNVISVSFATDSQMNVARLLENGLNIPATQSARASELFTALGETFTIEGETDVLGEDLPLFEGRSEPQFFVEPFETGVQFRLRAVPCDSAISFVPGRGKTEFIGLDSMTSVLVKRNFSGEKEKSDMLIESIPLLREQFNDDLHWPIPDPIDALDVLEMIKNHPTRPILNWPKGESLIIRKSLAADSIFRSVERKQEWFELGGSIEIEKNLVLSLKTLIALSKESESRFVKMANGEYLALTKTLKQELDTLAALVTPAKGDTVKLHPLALIAMADSYIGEQFESSREWIARFRANHEKKYTLPKGLKVDLRDYQRDGFQWLMRLGESQAGALLADDMGLGKTVQAIALLVARKKEGPALVIAPASLGFNWADEIRRFAPNLKPQILGTENREEQISKLSGGDILITTYGLVQRNPELFMKSEWNTMILDEAQAVKNTSAKRTQIIKEIPRKFTLITTGTPVENHLGELWNLFDIILPGFLGSAGHFRDSFQLPIERYENKQARQRLKRLISPFILRRTKEEVLTELPPKTEINLTVELGAKEMAFYEALRQEAIDKLANPTKEEDQRFQVLAEITKLRQACLSPKLIDKTSTLDSAKIEVLTEKVEELIEGNHQALVFSQFTGFLKMIANALDSKKIPYFYLDGSTPAKDRGDLVNQFQNGDRPIFLISLKAGGSGLNLTNADYVFHMDPWWNPAVEDQASDRAHRIGQERPVTVYRLIAAGSIEEKIIGLHQEKRGLAEALLSDSATSLKLNTTELIDIISKR